MIDPVETRAATPTAADFAGQPCLVLGAGRSGRAAARRLSAWGARVTLYDRDLENLRDPDRAWTIRSGPELPDFEPFRWVIQSPGVPVAPADCVVPEVDLAAVALTAPSIGVTGTNGKSTTTVLIGEMLRHSGTPVEVGGNLGTPLCDLGKEDSAWIVIELSSFQLEHVRWLRPRIAVLLNLAEDHLDRHPSLDAYGAAKERLVAQLETDGTVVFNLDDPWAARTALRAERRSLGFSTRARPTRGAYLEADVLVLAPEGTPVLRLRLDEMGISCRMHPANALAAGLAAWTAGAHPDGIGAALRDFEGLPHRAQPVAVRRDVTWVDDSKATNPAAAIASLESARGPIVWLAGGSGKGLDLKPLALAAARARTAIVFGQAGPELARALEGHPDVLRAETLADAVRQASLHARPGDTVLLSPACASFDEFRNFEERGERFAALVGELAC